MGKLRLLLAIVVVFNHVPVDLHIKYMSGVTAVEVFFIISGFLITLILDTKYTPERLGSGWVKKFYLARYFRLYPLYIIILVLAFLLAIPASVFAGRAEMQLLTWKNLLSLPMNLSNGLLIFYAAFTNLTMMFQDWVMFLTVKNNLAHIVMDRTNTDIYMIDTLGIKTGWSLGSELSFYLLAPWLLKRKTWIIATIVVLSLIGKLWFFSVYPSQDMGFVFFPFTLCWFLLGTLAYRAMKKINAGNNADRFFNKQTYLSAVVLSFIIVLLFGPVEHNYSLYRYLFPVIFVILIPVLFQGSKAAKKDTAIGEMSYPVYLLHAVVIGIAYPFFEKYFKPTYMNSLAFMLLILGTVIVGSIILSAVEKKYFSPFRKKFAL